MRYHTNYKIADTLGQPVVFGMQSNNYRLEVGFWANPPLEEGQTAQMWRLYLPAVRR